MPSSTSTPTSSPKMSSSSPISIGWPCASPIQSGSASSSISSTSSKSSGNWSMSSSYTNSMSCAFPSWPSRTSLSPPLMAQDSSTKQNLPTNNNNNNNNSSSNNIPSAYISDFDLFPGDLEEDELPYLDEAPAPPREYNLPIAMPLLPVYASTRPYADQKKRRRSSKNKSRQMGKPMSPIAEMPYAAV